MTFRHLYQRNPLLEVVPWLMLATALRFHTYTSGGLSGIASTVLANLAIFLALLLAARRMIERSGGTVQFGNWALRDQLRIGQQILNRVLVLMVGMTILVALLGFRSHALHLMLGFDGIAFDQYRFIGMVWSGFLAAMVYLMLIDAEQLGKPSLMSAANTLLSRWYWIVPAIALVALAHAAISFAQGEVRAVIAAMWTDGTMSLPVMKVVYFVFVFSFATLRLWITLLVLTYAIREGYRSKSSGTPSPVN